MLGSEDVEQTDRDDGCHDEQCTLPSRGDIIGIVHGKKTLDDKADDLAVHGDDTLPANS